MMMKKTILFLLAFCLLLAGCSKPQADSNETVAPTDSTSTVVEDTTTAEPTEAGHKISPLPDTTMENLSDAILPVSLGEGNMYVDEDGHTQLELKIYAYDMFDMVDIAALKVGDTIVRHSGDVEVLTMERAESGRICINGGLDNDGFELTTDDNGVFYEIGFNDAKNWYQVGDVIIRVSDDFKGIDTADLELGEVTFNSEDFLNGAISNYSFTPYNTIVRVEGGQIVELYRVYTP